VALDPHDSPYFRNNLSFSTFNRRVSGTNAAIGIGLVPASFYAVGLVRKDSYTTHTSLLAGESVVDAGILTWVLKNGTGRLRPSAILPGGSYADTWFKTYQPPLRADTSFPSAHSIAAFSVATVFARVMGLTVGCPGWLMGLRLWWASPALPRRHISPQTFSPAAHSVTLSADMWSCRGENRSNEFPSRAVGKHPWTVILRQLTPCGRVAKMTEISFRKEPDCATSAPP